MVLISGREAVRAVFAAVMVGVRRWRIVIWYRFRATVARDVEGVLGFRTAVASKEVFLYFTT